MIDHDERRAELARAVWRIVVREGVRGASVRGVARETGLSMGSVRHFFSTQDQLLLFALREVIDQAARRIESGAAARAADIDGGRVVPAAVALLEQLLPLDEERLVEARVWAAFTSPPLTDPSMAAIRQRADDGVRQLCHDCLTGLAQLGHVHPRRDLELETERLCALLDGLLIHLLLDADSALEDRVTSVLSTHLGDLGSAPSTSGQPRAS